MTRGKMYNEELFKQGQDFSGLRYGNITPSDLDGIMEYKDKFWIIFELKHEGVEPPFGQRLMLERLHNDLIKTGKPVALLIAEHNTPADEPINAAECIIAKIYNGQEWVIPKSKRNLREQIDLFFDFYR